MRKTIMLLATVLVFYSCKSVTEAPIDNLPVDTVYTSDNTYNLNVVYFVPKDNPALPDYQRRLSEILLAGQEFYRSQMQRSGYGNKTFGLLKDTAKKLVKIITINGALTKDQYTSATYGNIIKEVNAYFQSNPTEKTSEHTLIICPDNGIDNPFFGVGKSCLAKDYGEFDLKYLGTNTHNFTKYYGGLMHELGHGLNLPHNRQQLSLASTLGTSLMGGGNTTLGLSPTFLTDADCAILNTNQVFQTTTDIAYYTATKARITKIYANYVPEKAAIVASGRFTSDIPVTDVTYYLDPNYNNEGVGVNRDYNAVTWRSKVIGVDSFYIEIPLSEMEDKFRTNNPAELKVKLVHQNGNITNTTYDFQFRNSIPDIDLKPDVDKSAWRVIDMSSQENGYDAHKAIDGDLVSFWFARFSSPAAVLPHYLTVDMGKEYTSLNGLVINQRQDVYRMVKLVEVFISIDNINWQSMGEFTVPNVKTATKLAFPSTKSFRYFKVLVKSNYDTVEPNKSCIAELGVF